MKRQWQDIPNTWVRERKRVTTKLLQFDTKDSEKIGLGIADRPARLVGQHKLRLGHEQHDSKVWQHKIQCKRKVAVSADQHSACGILCKERGALF